MTIKQNTVLAIRIPPPLKALVIDAAKADGRSINSYVEQMLRRTLEQKTK